MDRLCVARGIGEAGEFGSRCIRHLGGAELLLAIMDVSARSILLADKPQVELLGSPVLDRAGKTVAHRFLSLSRRPWRGMGPQPWMITPFIRAFLLFDRAAGFVPPRPQYAEASAQRLSRQVGFRGTRRGSALRASSTMARSHSWAPYAGWEVGSGIFRTSKLRP
jgi:hypothetical protein